MPGEKKDIIRIIKLPKSLELVVHSMAMYAYCMCVCVSYGKKNLYFMKISLYLSLEILPSTYC